MLVRTPESDHPRLLTNGPVTFTSIGYLHMQISGTPTYVMLVPVTGGVYTDSVPVEQAVSTAPLPLSSLRAINNKSLINRLIHRSTAIDTIQNSITRR